MQTFSLKLRIILDWKDDRLSASPKLSPYIYRRLDARYNYCFWAPRFTTPNSDIEELIMERYLLVRRTLKVKNYETTPQNIFSKL